MHGGFAQFAAFDQDVIDNRKAVGRGRLQMPVLAVGGDHSLGSTMAYIMRFAADNVREVVVKDAGHWLMEEQPKATVTAIVDFLSGAGAVNPRALSVAEVAAMSKTEASAGTSGSREFRQSCCLAIRPRLAPTRSSSRCQHIPTLRPIPIATTDLQWSSPVNGISATGKR